MSASASPADPWFQSLFADRIGGANYGKGTEIYKFEKIKRAKRKALAEHPERKLLDFGIGENDDMADESVRDALAKRGQQGREPRLRRQRHPELQGRRRRVHAAAVRRHARPGDRGLPLHRLEARLRDAPGVLHQPRRRHADDRARLPRRGHVDALPRRRGRAAAAARRRTASSPTSTASRPTSRSGRSCSSSTTPTRPTGAVATQDFYKRVIEFAHKHQVVIVQDAAHILLSYAAEPLSFLQVDGAKEVGVEVHSMSKGFNMIGWRLGFVVRASRRSCRPTPT